MAIFREIGDRQGEGNDLGNLGNAYLSLSQYDKAIDFHTKALAISREIGDRQREGSNLGNMGDAYCSLGQSDKAIDYYTQALAIFEEIKSPFADRARQKITELKAEKDSWNRIAQM